MSPEQALRECEPHVRRVAAYLTRDPELREDLRQEGRIEVLRALAHYRPELGPFSRYARPCFAGRMRNALAQWRARCELVSLEEFDSPEETLGLTAPDDPEGEVVARAFWAQVLREADLTPTQRRHLGRAMCGEALRRSGPLHTVRTARAKVARAREKLEAV